MSKADIWMPLYIGDYLSDTMHLTTEQHGAYLLLIMHYWKSGKPLPSCPKKLATICRLSDDAWSIAQAELKQFFDTKTNTDFWIHSRIASEMKKADEKKEKASDKARNAANARHGKGKKERKKDASSSASSSASSNQQAMLGRCPSPSPSEEKEKPPLPPKGDDVDFISFWEAYPKKDGKGYALKAWGQAKKKKTLPHIQAVLLAIEREKKSAKWLKDGGQFIPNPSTWLNGMGWENGSETGDGGHDDRIERFIAKHQPGGVRAGDKPTGNGIQG